MKFNIGPGLECDLDQLLHWRLLVQAMSGAGKSWLIRRILEQTYGHLLHFVLDSEGDFKTLREKYQYVLIGGDDGDLPIPEDADALAEKLLELGVSAIIDVSTLDTGDEGGPRARFIGAFIEGLRTAPQDLWKPSLLVIDEAQEHCPQGVRRWHSSLPIRQMSGQARKRGIGVILATNRLSDLDKTAASHCRNKLIGASMDVDAKRAGQELGISDWKTLSDLEPGEFYAFGPALCRKPQLVHVGPVETFHPSPSGRADVSTPPPMGQVRAALKELTALQKEEPKQATASPGTKAPEPVPCNHAKEIAEARQELTNAQQTISELAEEGVAQERRLIEFRDVASKAAVFRAALHQLVGDLPTGEGGVPVDEEAIVERVLARIPQDGAAPVQVTPPEALRKKYLQEAADRLYGKLSSVDGDQRRVLEYLLGLGKFEGVTTISKALTGQDGGTGFKQTQEAIRELRGLSLVRLGGVHGKQYKENVEAAVAGELAPHTPEEGELHAVTQNVLARLVSGT